jgi:selenide,water dikinase
VLPAELPDWKRHLLADPQTSGGLLVACAPERAEAIVKTANAAGCPAARVIGHAEAGKPSVRIVA